MLAFLTSLLQTHLQERKQVHGELNGNPCLIIAGLALELPLASRQNELQLVELARSTPTSSASALAASQRFAVASRPRAIDTQTAPF
jgi:hypothetical protein